MTPHPFRARLADVIDAHTHDGRVIDRATLDAPVGVVEEIINEFVQDACRERCTD
jgi:hypothetical protein